MVTLQITIMIISIIILKKLIVSNKKENDYYLDLNNDYLK